MKYPELFIEVQSGDRVEIQKHDGAFVAALSGESLGLARVMAASPDLLAYAECEEAWQKFLFDDFPAEHLREVLVKHGWDAKGLITNFLAGLRTDALDKAR